MTKAKPSIKFFTPDNTPLAARGRVAADLVIGATGLFTISEAAYDKLGRPEKIVIGQDTNYKENWYISPDESGYPLRYDKVKKAAMLNHKVLSDEIKVSLDCPKDWTIKFNINPADTVLFGLIKKEVVQPRKRNA